MTRWLHVDLPVLHWKKSMERYTTVRPLIGGRLLLLKSLVLDGPIRGLYTGPLVIGCATTKLNKGRGLSTQSIRIGDEEEWHTGFATGDDDEEEEEEEKEEKGEYNRRGAIVK